MSKNEGIILNNGNLNAEQLAVGKSASITISSISKNSDIAKNIEILLEALEKEKNNIDNYQDVRLAGETLKEEVGKEKPDTNILSILLTLISNSVPAISGITKVVKVIKEAIDLVSK